MVPEFWCCLSFFHQSRIFSYYGKKFPKSLDRRLVCIISILREVDFNWFVNSLLFVLYYFFYKCIIRYVRILKVVDCVHCSIQNRIKCDINLHLVKSFTGPAFYVHVFHGINGLDFREKNRKYQRNMTAFFIRSDSGMVT